MQLTDQQRHNWEDDIVKMNTEEDECDCGKKQEEPRMNEDEKKYSNNRDLYIQLLFHFLRHHN